MVFPELLNKLNPIKSGANIVINISDVNNTEIYSFLENYSQLKTLFKYDSDFQRIILYDWESLIKTNYMVMDELLPEEIGKLRIYKGSLQNPIRDPQPFPLFYCYTCPHCQKDITENDTNILPRRCFACNRKLMKKMIVFKYAHLQEFYFRPYGQTKSILCIYKHCKRIRPERERHSVFLLATYSVDNKCKPYLDVEDIYEADKQ